MSRRRRALLALRGRLTDLAHRPGVIATPWHDRLEWFAYKIVDPLVWL